MQIEISISAITDEEGGLVRLDETMRQPIKKMPCPEHPSILALFKSYGSLYHCPNFFAALGEAFLSKFLNQSRLSSDQFPLLLNFLLIATGGIYV